MACAKKITEAVLAWSLGGIFLYAGILKLLRPDLLLVDIQSYQLLPYRLAYLGSLYLPALEIVAGALLCRRRFRIEAAWVIVGLMVIFIVALLSAWLRGIDISCGCFGRSEATANYPLLIGRDILLLIAAIGLICLRMAAANNDIGEPHKPTKAR